MNNSFKQLNGLIPGYATYHNLQCHPCITSSSSLVQGKSEHS